MKIVLVGASGFVGTRILDLYKHSDFDLVNYDVAPSEFYPDITITGDVLDKQKLSETIKNTDCVILLAAQHRDDVTPVSLYYDVNVQGLKNVLKAMEENNCKRLLFFSSVAVYGLDKDNPDESFTPEPFNHYGKSKWEAELVLQDWYKTHSDWNINIIRPSVIFGERNRGNVYNLFKQIASGKFIMIGSGNNEKSMAYVGNVASFAKYLVENFKEGYNLFNYTDKPDFSMNKLVPLVYKALGKEQSSIRIPYWIGIFGGYCFDILACILRRKLPISSIRVKKFCATTSINANKAHSSGFEAPFSLEVGLNNTLTSEFIKNKQ